MKILGDKNAELNADMNAHRMAATFPRLKHDFNAIKELREMYRALGIDAAQRKRSSAGLGRHVAVIPPPMFVWLTLKFPQVLRNQNLLRQFLRNNRQYCVVEKL